MLTTAALLAAEDAAATHELPIPPWLVGVIAVLTFAFLLGVTWSFRGTHHKYAPAPGHGDEPTGEEPHWPEHPGHH
jgi:hypothetical protein